MFFFKIEDDDLLEKYDTTSDDKSSVDIKNEFDSKAVYNKEFLKTKINNINIY